MGGGSSKAKKTTTVLPPKPAAGPDGKPPLEVAPETVPAAKSVSAPPKAKKKTPKEESFSARKLEELFNKYASA